MLLYMLLPTLVLMIVEKIEYDIDWSKFRVGYSFFIPCLDTKAALKIMRPVLRRLKYKVLTKVVIEDGVRGVRVWRLKG